MTTLIADCGKSESHIFNLDLNQYAVITHQDLMHLNIPNLSPGDELVIEGVHLRPREENSLAQPYTFDQLKQMKHQMKERNITILLFPCQSTPKARGMLGLEKSDENDVRAIGNYLNTFPHIVDTLQEFNPISTEDHQDKHESMWADRKQLSADVNRARNVTYGMDSDHPDFITRWMQRYSLTLLELLGPELAECIGIESYVRDPKRLKKNGTPSRLYSILATLLRPNGELRLRSDTGKLPEWKYVKRYYFCLCPNHRGGGVVASNYKHHMRPAISGRPKRMFITSKEEATELALARSCADKKLQIIWTTIRNLIVEQFAVQ